MSGKESDAPAGVRQVEVPSRLRSVKKAVPRPAKAVARGSTRVVGRGSSRWRTDPDFLIIGTKRGGTTSLWNYLVGHPDVMPMFPASQELKSPHYFDIHYSKGRSWYRSFFPTRRRRESHHRRTGRRAVAGEASPYYMFHPLAPARMASDLPEARLIISLRNPVDRIWSHYHERVAGRTETLAFEGALSAEKTRLDGEEQRIVARAPHYYSFHHDLSSYLARGMYDRQLKRLYDLFPQDRLLVLRAEDFYADPQGQVDVVCRFLGLPETDLADPAQYNRLPRATIPEEVRARLEDYYRPSVLATERILGRELRWF